MDKKVCDIFPPREILDVLHEAEAKGIDIPKPVDDWWESQTAMDFTTIKSTQ